MTPSEQLVGRRLPPLPRHIDTLMAGFLAEDGTPRGRFEPSERWLRPAHVKARRNGWIRLGARIGFGSGRPAGIWYPTEAGVLAAREAAERVAGAHAARRDWALDFRKAHRERGTIPEDPDGSAPFLSV